MEQRLNSSPPRHKESDGSWRKKGGGPWALVTVDSFFFASTYPCDRACSRNSATKDFCVRIIRILWSEVGMDMERMGGGVSVSSGM
jgi:hypothetical protein